MAKNNCDECPYVEHLVYGMAGKRDAICKKLRRSIKKYAYYPEYTKAVPDFCPMIDQEITFKWAK